MKRFVMFFPPGLVASLWLMGFVFGNPMDSIFLLLIPPWAFIAHFIGKIFEKSTSDAIDRLLRGMAQAKQANRAGEHAKSQ